MRGGPRGPGQEHTVMREQARAVEEKGCCITDYVGSTFTKYSLSDTDNSQITAGSVWKCTDTQEYLHLPDVTAYVTCTQWTPAEQRIISIQNHHFLPDMKGSFIKDVQKSVIYRNNIYFTCLLCIFPASISIQSSIFPMRW